jgi:hypothetical protein
MVIGMAAIIEMRSYKTRPGKRPDAQGLLAGLFS